jgi:hypothetical protein
MRGTDAIVVRFVVRFAVPMSAMPQEHQALEELDGPTQRCSKQNVSMHKD